MKRWKWALLIFELALFALILVLPQVDLPDFAFHCGTAPVVMKARFSVPPVITRHSLMPLVQRLSINGMRAMVEETNAVSSATNHFRLSLLCILLC